MKNLTIYSIIAISALLTGCAVKNDNTGVHGLGLTYQSDVKRLNNGDYFIEAEAAPTAGRIAGAKGVAFSKASAFCKANNKSLKEDKIKTNSHLLVNGVARLTFSCI